MGLEEIKFLALTILVELPVALLLLGTSDWRRIAVVVVSVNFISHPIVWQLLYAHHLNWFVAEIGVALLEAALLALVFNTRPRLAAITGVVMNLVTAAIGWFFF